MATDLSRVRVEDGSSMGRSYTAKQNRIEGIGQKRSQLRTKTFNIPDDKLVLDSLPAPDLRKSSKEDILAYFLNSYDLNSALFACLRDDSVFYMKPDPLRRPLIFYFAHTCSVYANKLALAGVMDDIDPYLQKMFETGVDEMSWDDMDDMQDDDYAWPTVAEAEAFRQRVKAAVIDAIKAMPDPREEPITMASPYWALVMGFEHERIHIETSSVLIRQLPIDAVVKPSTWRDCPHRAATPEAAPANALVAVEPTRVVLGKPDDFPEYGWDNEYGKRVVDVPAFEGSRFMVTNAEFLPFVLAGGYKEKRWWVSPRGDDEGWRWVTYRNATHPSFWVATADNAAFFGGKEGLPYQKDDGHPDAGTGETFALRAELSIIPMPWDWPAEVNYLEARAFLNWKAAQEGVPASTYRLPTEAEYHAMRDDPSPFPEAQTGRRYPDQVAGLPADEAGRALMLAAPADVPAPPSSVPEHIPVPRIAASTPSSASSSSSSSSSSSAAATDGGDGITTQEAAAAAAADGSDATPAYFTSPETFDVVMHPERCPGNTNMRFHSPSPVHLFPPSTAGFYDTHGNAWEYVEDHFAGLPSFKIHYLYDDFSTPCFDGWHTMIMGGSWVSTGDQSSNFGRYAFRRHFFQHLGFRYVRLTGQACKAEAYPGEQTVKNLWEGMGTVSQEVTDGYAAAEDKSIPAPLAGTTLTQALDFPAALSDAVAGLYTAHRGAGPEASAATLLHVQCGAGGVTMQLCRHFGGVVATHDDEPVLRQARVLQHHGLLEYQKLTEGILSETACVRVDAAVKRGKAAYVEASPEDLSAAITANAGRPFDAVLVDGALTKMTQPLKLLTQLGGLVGPSGVVLVLSDHHWDAAVTPRNSWLGGFNMNGEEVTTKFMIARHLASSAGLGLAGTADVPVLRREDSRRFTLSIVEALAFSKAARAAAAAAAAEEEESKEGGEAASE